MEARFKILKNPKRAKNKTAVNSLRGNKNKTIEL